MPIPVRLTDLVVDLQMLPDGACCFINRKTGELILSGDGDFDEHSVEVLDLPPETDLGAYLDGEDDWLSLPDKFDFHEWDMMRRFAECQESPAADRLLDAIHGNGAFRIFRKLTERFGLRDAWFEYRDGEFERILAEALDEMGIPYVRG